ncbi:MAG: 50S ribosomal protein L11 methyltransferase [Sediminibacterium sp.]|jgi:ribosomal protein L11 methyltransferase|nr:MAG: 50S ribosomal protein L11 methyltransferase [Sediminibacterium sp.]
MSKEYIQIAFDFENQDQFEILVAQLSALGFDGFSEEEASLGINDGVKMSNKLGVGAGHCKTFILNTEFEANFLDNELDIIFKQYNIKYSKSIIKEENWNAIWESNFEPVRVANFVGIRAHFHPVFDPKVSFEIEITPKMSFGTGHHATTFTVIELMESMDFKGKNIYDFGTGTGILAILAEKLGAASVLAVDNDDWCIENSIENIQNNDCQLVSIEKVESAYQDKKFDIIIANVNRHIIEANMLELTQLALPGSVLVLSGLLIEDQSDMIQLANNNGWKFQKSRPLNGWISLLFNLN